MSALAGRILPQSMPSGSTPQKKPVVEPGSVRVQPHDSLSARETAASGLPPEVVAGLRAGECLPSGTGTTDVAGAVLFLLSERAAAITGQTLIVDAGTTA